MSDNPNVRFIPFGTKPIAEMTLSEIIEELNNGRQLFLGMKREIDTLRALLVQEIVEVTYGTKDKSLDNGDTTVVDSEQSETQDEEKGKFQA